MFTVSVTKDYLLIPVKLRAPKLLLTVFSAEDREKKLYEWETPFPRAGEEPDYSVAVPVRRHRGEALLVCGSLPDEELARITLADERPAPAPGRPVIHFSPENGWLNDPNGLVRLSDGEARMYYQYHPFGVEWGPMHWGSASSRDLLHWEAGDIALFPDRDGTIFSGSGWRDDENAAGFGPGALLFYYTCAGGTQAPWSRDGVFTQRLAVSADGGRTLEKQPGLLLPNLVHDNRDPKVFRHEASGAYIMTLYLAGNDYAIFRSPDLIHWEQTQQLTLPEAWECPDLFPLTVEGEEKWVFWSADSFYFVGSFDGWRFTPEQPRRTAYANRIGYAAQTFAREEGRVLSVAWLRLPNAGRRFTGVMSVPMELTLARDAEGYALRMHPCRELSGAMKPVSGTDAPEAPWVLRADVPADAGSVCVSFPGGELTLDMDAGTGRFGEASLSFAPGKALPLLLIADYAVFELYLGSGAVYAPEQNLSSSLAGPVSVAGAGGGIPFTLSKVD